MADMRPNKIPVAEQEPEVRAHNFEEVTLGYSLEKAVREARRCLQEQALYERMSRGRKDTRVHRKGGRGQL